MNLNKPELGAVFKVIKVDTEGSGMDFYGHLGHVVFQAKRCCKNCSCIFGIVRRSVRTSHIFTCANELKFGPFIPGELKALNKAAREIENAIHQHMVERSLAWVPRKP